MIEYAKYISISATIFCIIGYLPEIYSLSYAIYHKIEQKIKSDMWSIWILSALLSVTYAFIINDMFVIINTVTILVLNIVVFILKKKYISVKNKIIPINNI
jgi:hypothetical protein